MTITDDPAADFDAASAAEEFELFGPEDPAVTMPAPEAVAEPRKPGPRADPNSARQRKLAAAEAKKREAASPRRKSVPTKKAVPAAAAPGEPEVNPVHVTGAQTILGWIAQPLALAGIAANVASEAPRVTPKRKAQLQEQALALTLDSMTIAAYEDELAQGIATAAPHLPWAAQALERAAQVGPYANAMGAVAAVVLQVLCNHGLLPVSKALRTMSPQDLARKAGVDLLEVSEE